MYRIGIMPIDNNNVHLIVEQIDVIGEAAKLISICNVEFKPGVTSYTPIPPAKTMGKFPEYIDDEIRCRLRAYQDGRDGEKHYSWMMDLEEKEENTMRLEGLGRG
jgi:hypothetical protein